MYFCSLALTEMNQLFNQNEEMSVILVIKSHLKKIYHHTALTIKKGRGGQTGLDYKEKVLIKAHSFTVMTFV
jgi:hypothetical protein